MTLEAHPLRQPPIEPPMAVKKGIREGGHPRASKPNLTVIPNETVREVFEPDDIGPNEITEEVSREAEQAATERALTKPRKIGRRTAVALKIAAAGLTTVTGTQVVIPAAVQEWNGIVRDWNTAVEQTRANAQASAQASAEAEQQRALTVTRVIEKQTAYPETQQITKAEVEKKYNVRLLNQHEADVLMGISDPADIFVQDWTEPELHSIDQNLANTPPNMIAEYGGVPLSISIGSLSEIKTYEIAGSTTCADKCAGNFSYSHDLMNLSRSDYDSDQTINSKQGLVDHELGHRMDDKTQHDTKPDFQAILGDMSYMQLDAFSDNPSVKLNPNNPDDARALEAIDVLKSFAGGESNPQSPHQIFVEGVAQSCGLYAQMDYPTFVKTFGQFLDGEIRPDGSYSDAYAYYLENAPVPNSELQEFFPKADALYRLIQTKFFGGYGYDSDHNLIKGSDAVPAQTRIPIPTQPPIDGGEIDPGMIGDQNQDIGTTAPTESPIAFAPGTVVLDGRPIGSINNGHIT
jgi:hypothetical protein